MLVLAIVALEVPLASSVADRVDAEVRSQARGQADVVAASAAEVVARIRAVLRRTGGAGEGPAPAPATPLEFGDLRVDIAARRATLAGEDVDLARKEFDLLAELARHAGRVVRREDLMARVWDENWFGSTKTLDVHMGWLRRKLGDDPADPRFVHTVRGVGFRFAAPEEGSP